MFGRPPVNSVAAETPEERRMSEYVFQKGRIPWCATSSASLGCALAANED